MLKSVRNGACAFAAALTFMAGAAQAESHIVLILEGGYFPSVTYAAAGDSLIFDNQSGATHKLTGPDGSWESGPIALEGTFQLQVTADTPLTYSEDVGEDEEGMSGEISFAEPPLTD